jgi:DNA modification methylase
MLIQADARHIPLADKSVHCCVTSPPYWGLRRYLPAGDPLAEYEMGGEQTIDDYVAGMVAVFREVWRVLRPDGTLWANFGDSYNGYYANQYATGLSARNQQARQVVESGAGIRASGLKPKDLCMIPARVALALQAAGWTLRSDIIWSKPNPMPESVTDRPTTSHEHLFLLAKQPRYYYDADAIREENAGIMPWGDKLNFKMNEDEGQGRHGKTSMFAGGNRQEYIDKYYTNGRNARSVWTANEVKWKLRSDLSDADRLYVLGELARRGLSASTQDNNGGRP